MKKQYCVYIIRSSKWVKIGWTDNLDRRIEQFKTGNPSRITLVARFPCKSKRNAIHLERLFHEKFNDCRREGEWFSAKNVINKLKKSGKIDSQYQKTDLPCYPDNMGLTEAF